MKPATVTLFTALLLAPLAALPADSKPAPAKAPFRVLYSNDTTHTMSCVSPYHKGKPMLHAAHSNQEAPQLPFTPQMIEGAVDETAETGIEVHMLQPGFGWVPWWKSRLYPFGNHVDYMNKRFGASVPKGGWAGYMASGGDIVEVFARRCSEKKLAPFVSLRMNDAHGHELSTGPPGDRDEIAWATLAPIHVDHPEWRLGSKLGDWNQRPLNWTIPEVREYKLRMVEELCRQYPLAGFELDFMRFPVFFRQDQTTREQRASIMTEFIGQVRRILDRSSPDGQRRWLCVRVPAFLAAYDAMGIDLPRWVGAGVDMVNLSNFFFTAQEGDMADIRLQVPQASVYVEMCHTTRVGPVVGGPAYDNFSYRRTTAAQFYTTAHLAYARGLDGVSTFNFVYYREHGSGPRGPFCEPPFEVFKRLGDREWLARQPQHYFLSEIWDSPRVSGRALPKNFQRGQSHRFALDMAPPSGGWTKPGRLRIQASEDLGTSRWRCLFNGQELAETPDRSEPYANPYPALLGGPEHHRAWLVPQGLPKDGANQIELTLQEGISAKVVFLDLSMP